MSNSKRQMINTKVMKDKQGTPEENMGTDACRNSLDLTNVDLV